MYQGTPLAEVYVSRYLIGRSLPVCIKVPHWPQSMYQGTPLAKVYLYVSRYTIGHRLCTPLASLSIKIPHWPQSMYQGTPLATVYVSRYNIGQSLPVCIKLHHWPQSMYTSGHSLCIKLLHWPQSTCMYPSLRSLTPPCSTMKQFKYAD